MDKARQAAASALPGGGAGKRKKKKKGGKKKETPFHKRLQGSPLMQMLAGKDKGKNRMAAGRPVR